MKHLSFLKYVALTAALLLGSLSYSSAQNVFTIVGTVSNGSGVPGQPVYISSDSTQAPFFQYNNTVTTNGNGYYADTITAAFTGSVTFYVSTYDTCAGTWLSQTVVVQAGVWSVTADFLICSSGGGCTASFGAYPDSTNNNTYYFYDFSTSATSYSWSFGDGSSSMVANPTHVYAQPGTYTVCLTITGPNNCTDNYCSSVTVAGSPGPCDASFWSADSLSWMYFGSSSTGSNLTYVWDFGDNTLGTGQYPVHQYNASGTYTVCLTIDDGNGCTDTECAQVTVNLGGGGNCNALFYSSNGSNNDVYFYDWSSGGGVFGLTYSWDFGDNTTSALVNPTHTYAASGWYYVCLTVDDGQGCTDSYCDYVQVSACNLNFTLSANGNVITGTNTSTGGTNYDWYIWGNGTNNVVQNSTNLTFTAPAAGVYTVCLYSYDSLQNFCDSSCASITVSGGNPGSNIDICGAVFASNNYVDDGLAYLIVLDTVNATLTAVDTTSIDSGGYCFMGVPAGTYYVKAALSNSSVYYSQYLPTYYGDILYWVAASTISSTNYLADINLVLGNNPGGPGFIGGSVWQGANKAAGVGDPVAGVRILLLDANDNPVTVTESDANGDYMFSNLAYGTYKVYAEVWGKTTIPSVVEVTSGEPALANVNIVIGETLITTGVGNADPLNADAISGFWPNPANAQAAITIAVAQADKFTFNVYNALGQQVLTATETVSPGSDRVVLNVSELPEGMYHVRIAATNSGLEQTRKLVLTR